MNLRLYEVAMAGCIRVLLIDLLAERATFGHGGNQEVVRPLAAAGDVEVLLVTPQYQSIESSNQSDAGEVNLTEMDVPDWDDDYPFWQSTEVELEGRVVTFRRIVMPMHEDQERMESWLSKIKIDALVCSGSRRNVSIWEEWMGPAGTLMRSSAQSGIPTLGICFGHQLLCHTLGSTIERADSLSSGIWKIDLTVKGDSDELLTSHRCNNIAISGLFTHQDHVITVPKNCTLLSTTSHNKVTAVRVNDSSGNALPAWGIQFHPEAAKARIERAFEWGHITAEEHSAFKGEHDGAGILASFASIILNQ
jgi:GMP synthase-like glutamine amidotransferase